LLELTQNFPAIAARHFSAANCRSKTSKQSPTMEGFYLFIFKNKTESLTQLTSVTRKYINSSSCAMFWTLSEVNL
jgi:hypothetical protein